MKSLSVTCALWLVLLPSMGVAHPMVESRTRDVDDFSGVWLVRETNLSRQEPGAHLRRCRPLIAGGNFGSDCLSVFALWRLDPGWRLNIGTAVLAKPGSWRFPLSLEAADGFLFGTVELHETSHAVCVRRDGDSVRVYFVDTGNSAEETCRGVPSGRAGDKHMGAVHIRGTRINDGS